jgi:pimeloyl-ACP methyl ester carboxylesterase
MKPTLALLSILVICSPGLAQQAPQLKKVAVNGVELHYQDEGTGQPIVLIHGGFGDYRTWSSAMSALSNEYRVIAYSRRYNFPNENADIDPNFSARVEAEDLKALIEALDLAPAHVVGHSYGGLTALFLAMDHPGLVRSLVLAEPALMTWLQELPEGADLLADFEATTARVATEFRNGDEEAGVRIFFDWVIGPGAYDRLPPAAQAVINTNRKEAGAILTSEDPFPSLLRKDVERLAVPVLLISGGDSIQEFKLIDAELERLLPNVNRIILRGASHNMILEQPAACNQALLDFFGNE